MVLSVLNLQEAYAKALLVDRDALPPRRRATCCAATRCCSTPTRPTCGRSARRCARSLGAAEDPIAELRPYVERIVAERGSTVSVAGGWGR